MTKFAPATDMIHIGIDTGTHTGIAVWDSRSQCFRAIEDVAIHKAMEIVAQYKGIAESEGVRLYVRVEDPRQRTWFGTENMTREEERKKLQGVGSVKRDAAIWEAYLTDLGVWFEMVAPKCNLTKIKHETFVNITKWKGRTNEHKRDAAMLVFGR